MWSNKVLLFALLLTAANWQPSRGWALPDLNPLKNVNDAVQKVKNGVSKAIEAIKNKNPGEAIGTGIETAKDVGKNIIPSPSSVLNDIKIDIPDPLEIAKNVSELVKTTNVFKRNNDSLNCFGLSIKVIDKALEKIFMQTTKAKDVRFYFSTRRSPNVITYHAEEDFTLDKIDFDVTRPTIVVVHGFMSSGKEAWTNIMKNAFLNLYDANAIVVDWQEGSNTWNYYSAAISTRIVGLQIAKLFAKIREQAVASGWSPMRINEWGSIYLVGHSLGAHISAYSAYLIKESQKEQPQSWIVGRITGLDPAQPCFSIADQSLKLDKDDAPFVDVIHTNARHLVFLGLGLPEQLGFVDFYPNGGKAQPGCSEIDPSIWSFLLLPANLIQESVCSHGRSHAFLTESIIDLAAENCTFYGYKWDRRSESEGKSLKTTCGTDVCHEMGITASNGYPYNDGIYYVPTRAGAPYCTVNEDTMGLLKNSPYEKNIFAKVPKKYPSS